MVVLLSPGERRDLFVSLLTVFLGLVCSYSLFLTTFSSYIPDLSDVAIYPYIRSSLILLAFTNMFVL